ncbi:MAG: hypothetical protein ACI85F_002850 [Bacteroidia bacterium]|jgi:hypothetical protein
MVKRVIIAIVVLGLIGGVAAWYLIDRQETLQLSDPAQAIPIDAALILRFPEFRKALEHFEESQYHHRLNDISNIQRIRHWGLRLDSVLSEDNLFAKSFGESSWYVSYHFPDEKTSVPFYCHQLENQPSPEQMKLFMDDLFGSKATYSQQMLSGQTVYKAVFEEPFEMVQFCIMNGVLMFSDNDGLLATAIDQLSTKNGLTETANFQKMLEVHGEHVDLNVYLPYSQSDNLLRPILKNHSLDLKTGMGSIADWTQLDINFKEEGVMFNGFTFVEDSTDMLLNLIRGQEPQHLEASSILPSNLVYLQYIGISDLPLYLENQIAIRENRGTLDSITGKLSTIKIDAQADFYDWIGNGFGTCITAPRGSKYHENSYFIIQMKDRSAALAGLENLDTELLGADNIASTATMNEVAFYPTAVPQLLPLLLSTGKGLEQLSRYMILDDHVVFGHDESALRAYLKYIVADKELSKDLSFSSFKEHLASRSNLFIYSKILPAYPILEHHLSYQTQGKITDLKEWLGEFGSFGLQLSDNGQAIYTNAYLSYGAETIEDAGGGYECELDTVAVISPTFVTNHYNKEQEVMVQDAKNQLYLFNRIGKEIWKREIDGSIKSEIHEVDAFKNGKIQFVFNTETKIYLIDRKGNDVDGFPIRLKANAITPLCVANYDNKRNYRLVITCENNRIYNYTLSGKATQGWSHNKAKDPTTKGFQHFSVSGKDYYVTAESNGKVHLLDRRGKNRVKVGKRVENFSDQDLQVFVGKNSSSTAIYATDTSGVLFRISLKGKVSSMKLASMSSKHEFIVSDLDGDQKPEFIFNDLNLLTVYDDKYQKVKELRLSPETYGPFVVRLEEGKSGIGLYNPADGDITLLDKGLNTMSGFPQTGFSRFDLVLKNEPTSPNLIATTMEDNQVLIFGLD